MENAVEKIEEIVVNGTYTLRTYYKTRNEIDDIFGFWAEESE
ncbi:hypothetical protein PZE06_23815 [Robertmurraya sp. DFI.2.37]|nr:hypothetical protein [Robertmurraya sp. DFI.2.37]MDF1511162.1 hypothetical protein [Robertmurraya sp. DFI.2.37]